MVEPRGRQEAQPDVPGLIATLVSQQDEMVRITAAETLGQVGDDRAISAVVAAMAADPGRVAGAAAVALDSLDGRGYEIDPGMLLTVTDNIDWKQWSSGLKLSLPFNYYHGRVGQSSPDKEHVAFQVRNVVRSKISQILRDRATAAEIPTLAGYLQKGRESVQTTASGVLSSIAVEVLPAIDDPAVLQVLAAECGKHDSRGRGIDQAFSDALDRRPAEDLLTLLRNIDAATERDLGLLAPVIGALSRAGDRRAIPALLEWYERLWPFPPAADPPTLRVLTEARGAVAASLKKFGGTEVIEAMLGRVANGDEDAAKVLAECGEDPRIVPALISCLRQTWGASKDAGTGQTGGTSVTEALGKLGDDRAVPALIDCLRQTGGPAAARALGLLGDRRAVPALCEQLRPVRSGDDSGNTSSQSLYVSALVRIGDPAALPALREIDPGPVSPKQLDQARDWDELLSDLKLRKGIHESIAELEKSTRQRRGRWPRRRPAS